MPNISSSEVLGRLLDDEQMSLTPNELVAEAHDACSGQPLIVGRLAAGSYLAVALGQVDAAREYARGELTDWLSAAARISALDDFTQQIEEERFAQMNADLAAEHEQ